ncbi:MAG: hypothetical protein AAB521_03555 [Patescibacteria group bacterium]
MPLPEQDTPEREIAEERIYRKVIDLVSNVAVRRKNLPSQVHILIQDEITGVKVAAFLLVQYIGNNGMTKITPYSGAVLPSEETVMDAADILIKANPGMPMICDKEIADELSQNSLVWVEEDHYRLEGRPDGVLEVFTPYGALQSLEIARELGAKSVQVYTE